MLPILLKLDPERSDDRSKPGVAADDAGSRVEPEHVHYRRGRRVSWALFL